MNISKYSVAIALIILALISTDSVLLYRAFLKSDHVYTEEVAASDSRFEGKKTDDVVNTQRVFFTGDIMLARDVENRQASLKPGNSLSELQSLLTGNIVFGNFEASIPEIHVPTPSMVMKFSVAKENLPMIRNAGFTNLSLANNHALDYQTEGYKNTVNELESLGIDVAGHPATISTSSITYFDYANHKFSVLFINATFSYPDKTKWQSYVELAKQNSDYQIVYIHWGNEYELVHSDAEQALAEALIDEGVDIIVGHHPHVVQDIQIYKNRPIFYSLGNLVFDQYWNNDVSEGLVLGMSVTKNQFNFSLHPIETRTVKTQPRLMLESEKEEFLASLRERSGESIRAEILSSNIRLQF